MAEGNKSWWCEQGRCRDCAELQGIAMAHGPDGQFKAERCRCGCHDVPMVTPKHDWLDDRWADEIDLERAAAQAPPAWLVVAAEQRGYVDGRALDAAWRWLGRIALEEDHLREPWTVTCGCQTREIYLQDEDLRAVEELLTTELRAREIATHDGLHRYRVAQCPLCRVIYWFEVVER